MDLKNGMIIKCNSKEEAQEFIKEAYKQGFKWVNHIDGCEEKTCWCTGFSGIYYYLESNKIKWNFMDYENESIDYSTLKEKMKTMTKSDLKNGMVVELASGSRALVINGLLLFEDSYQGLSAYKDDLTTKIFNNEFQINKVFKSKLYNLCDVLTDGLSLIWEREEKNLPLIKELEDRKAIFNQCFGALLLAVEVDRSLEYELAKLWTEEWKERLEKQVYGNED